MRSERPDIITLQVAERKADVWGHGNWCSKSPHPRHHRLRPRLLGFIRRGGFGFGLGGDDAGADVEFVALEGIDGGVVGGLEQYRADIAAVLERRARQRLAELSFRRRYILFFVGKSQ